MARFGPPIPHSLPVACSNELQCPGAGFESVVLPGDHRSLDEECLAWSSEPGRSHPDPERVWSGIDQGHRDHGHESALGPLRWLPVNREELDVVNEIVDVC